MPADGPAFLHSPPYSLPPPILEKAMTEPTDPAAAAAAAIPDPRLADLERSLRNVADYYSDLIVLQDEAVHYEE